MQAVATSLDFTKENLGALCSLGSVGEKPSQIIFPIGKRGESLLFEDFSTIPSSLIVGTTGSGKSAFVKTAIIEMMQKYTPDQVRFAIYDSRRVDYCFFNTNPFLLAPVYSEPSKAKGLIQWSLVEARKRMNNLNQINEYPHIFVVLDDFGEMLPSSDTFSDLVQIFQVARRTKIHFWLITSTPSSNVLPTDLKANINHKIAFRVASKSLSRIVLDDLGAETLNVPGEIIAKLNNEIVKCESVFLDDADIEECLTTFTGKKPRDNISSSSEDESMGGGISTTETFIGEDGKDVLYKQAIEAALDMNQASVSLIQRRLKIGYSRAARIIDQMEEDGFIGPYDGAKPRLLLLSREQWQKLESSVSSDQQVRANDIAQSNMARPTPPAQQTTLTNQRIVLGTGYSIRTAGSSISIRYDDEEVIITSRSITELLYKRPGLLRKGNLSIRFSSPAIVDSPKQGQSAVDIPFESKDTKNIKAFCRQLSMDIGRPVVEL